MKNLDIKIGFAFYILFAIAVFTFVGCRHIEEKEKVEQKQIEQEVEQMLDFPKIAITRITI
jgi:hypothetical protein